VQSAHHSCRAIKPRRPARRRARGRRGSLHPWSQSLSRRRRLAVQFNQSHPSRRVSRVRRQRPRRDIIDAGAATSRAGQNAPPQLRCRRREKSAAHPGLRAAPVRALTSSAGSGGPGIPLGRVRAPPSRSGGPPAVAGSESRSLRPALSRTVNDQISDIRNKSWRHLASLKLQKNN